MTGFVKIDDTKLSELWAQGVSSNDLAVIFDVQYPAINRAAKRLGLAPRNRGGSQPRHQHVAAVRMPDMPLSTRPDWDALQAAVLRAKDLPAPQANLSTIATKHRLPVAVVQGLAGRLWA